MKKQFYYLILISLLISSPLFGQNVIRTSSIQSDPLTAEDVITRISSSSLSSAGEVIVDSFVIREPLPLLGHTKQDSLNLQYNEYTLVKRTMRINPEVLSVAFPEIVNYDRENAPIIDYNSLISYLLIAVNKQQEEVEELKIKISEIEKR